MRYLRTIGICFLALIAIYDSYSVVDSFPAISSGVVGLHDLVVVVFVFSLPIAGLLLALSIFSFLRDQGFLKWVAIFGFIASGIIFLLNAIQIILALIHFYS